MPMHDWSRVGPDVYHHFHQAWALQLCSALNPLLPDGFTALVEPYTAGLVPPRRLPRVRLPRTGVVVAQPVPDTRFRFEVPAEARLRLLASRVAIRYRMSELACVIEIVSPGNKSGTRAVQSFLKKTAGFLLSGVNVLLVDPFPPTPRDPHTLHKLIWDELTEVDTPYDPPADEPLLLAAYQPGDPPAGVQPEAQLEPFRVGAVLRDMPAWLDPDFYVNVPLEAAWQACSTDMRHLVERGRLPEE